MTTEAAREQAGEMTLAALARIPGLGTARPVAPMTDAEHYAEHTDPTGPLALFLQFGPCRCTHCQAHRAATGAA